MSGMDSAKLPPSRWSRKTGRTQDRTGCCWPWISDGFTSASGDRPQANNLTLAGLLPAAVTRQQHTSICCGLRQLLSAIGARTQQQNLPRINKVRVGNGRAIIRVDLAPQQRVTVNPLGDSPQGLATQHVVLQDGSASSIADGCKDSLTRVNTVRVFDKGLAYADLVGGIIPLQQHRPVFRGAGKASRDAPQRIALAHGIHQCRFARTRSSRSAGLEIRAQSV